jgi:hypothetical protein
MLLRQRRPRIEAPKHLAWIRELPSLIRGAGPVEAAHIRFSDLRYGKDHTGMSEKPDDMWVVPLAHDVHMAQHQVGEHGWWLAQGIDPIIVAAFLWVHTGRDDAGQIIIRNARLFTR